MELPPGLDSLGIAPSKAALPVRISPSFPNSDDSGGPEGSLQPGRGHKARGGDSVPLP